MGKYGHEDTGVQGCEEVRDCFLTDRKAGFLIAPQTHLPCVPDSDSSSLCSISPHNSHPTKLSFKWIKANAIRKDQQKTGCAHSCSFAAPEEMGSGTCPGSILKETGRDLWAQLWLPSPASRGIWWLNWSLLGALFASQMQRTHYKAWNAKASGMSLQGEQGKPEGIFSRLKHVKPSHQLEVRCKKHADPESQRFTLFLPTIALSWHFWKYHNNCSGTTM